MEKTKRLIMALFLGVSICCTAAVIALAVWINVSDVVAFEGVESNVVYDIIRVLDGKPLYGDPLSPPFGVAQYSPLYYLVCVGITHILGVSSQDPYQVSVISRVLSTVIGIMLLPAMYLFCAHVLQANRLMSVALSCIGFVLCAPFIFLARPDSLVSLSLLGAFGFGFLALEKWNTQSKGVSYAVLSGLLCAVAILSKQNGVQGFLIISPVFVIMRAWRPLLAFVLTWVTVLVIGLLFMHPVIGEALIANVVDGIRNGINFRAAFVMTYHPFFSQLALFVAFLIWWTIEWIQEGRPTLQGYFVWALWCLLSWASATGLKSGSVHLYFNDFILLWIVVCAALMTGSKIASDDRTGRQYGLTIILALFFIVFMPIRTAYVCGKYTTDLDILWNRYGSRTEVAAELKEQLRKQPGSWIVVEDQVLALFLPNNTVFPQRDVSDNSPAKQQMYRRFRALLKEGRVSYYVYSKPRHGEPSFKNFISQFQLACTVGNYTLYRYANHERQLPNH